MKRKAFIVFWRGVNPLITPLSGFAPWWILVETTGNKTGRVRRKPIAMGLREAAGTASIEAADDATVRRLNPYARLAGGWAAIDPVLVRITPR